MSLGYAQKLLDAGEFDKAAAVLGADSGPDATDPRRPLVLARIEDARGNRDLALDLLDRLRTARPDYAPGHLFFGIISSDDGRPEAAAAAFDRVLELQPANDVARSYRALAHLQLGEDDAAAAIFRGHGFNDNRMFRVRLTEWMELQWLEKNRFFAQRPAMPPPAGDSVSAPVPPVFAPGERDAGSDAATEATPPRAPGIVRRLRIESRASRLFHARRYPEMLQVLEPLARVPDPDDGVLFTCAFGAEMLHDYDLALEYLGRLPQETAQWPDALLAARGRLLVRQRRFREAAEDLNRVEVIGPEDYGANYYFGVLCLAHGERAHARRLFFRAHTQYLIDTLETQWWQIEQALLGIV